MATILLKKRDTTGAPGAGDLTNSTSGAEVAVNTYDKRLYSKDSGGNVVELGTNPSAISTGNLTATGTTTLATSLTGLAKLSSGVVSAATSGTDYAPATSGSGILKGNGSGGFSTASAGTDYAKPDTASTWSAAQTFNSGNLKLSGSSSGTGILNAPAAASTYTWTLPAATDTLAALGFAQTWTAAQTFNSGYLKLAGSTSGTSTLNPQAVAGTTTYTLPNATSTLGFLNAPAVGTKTASYTLATGDVGKYVQVGSSGSITIPDATFAEGDIISIFNNTSGNITITCTITTAYIAGTDSDKASVTLATRGLATIFFISSTVCVIQGNVS